MSGSRRLGEQEKEEMLEDARSVKRAEAFQAARARSQEGSLDDYIDFLSDNIELLRFKPSKHVFRVYAIVYRAFNTSAII